MVAILKGTVAFAQGQTAIIMTGGVGYEVNMPASDVAQLIGRTDEVTVFTHMTVREDAVALYGFLTQEEKALFLRLIGVSGIGPKAGLAALTTFKPDELISAISTQDDKAVARIPGIGKKSAQRIILELKGSFASSQDSLLSPASQVRSEHLAAAHDALLAMGFSPDEADLALKGAPDTATTDSALLQYALKRLGQAS